MVLYTFKAVYVASTSIWHSHPYLTSHALIWCFLYFHALIWCSLYPMPLYGASYTSMPLYGAPYTSHALIWSSLPSRLLTAMPLLRTELKALPDNHNVSVAFPDDGAYKRFNAELSGFPTITCVKVRTGTKRVINIKEGMFLLSCLIVSYL